MRVVVFVVAMVLAWGGVASGHCSREYANLVGPTTLPLPEDPVVAMRDSHWTVIGSANSRVPEKALLDKNVKADLRRAFNQVFEDAGVPVKDARLLLGGLESWKPNESVNVARDLKPETVAVVDAWARETLRIAREGTGEDLEIANIALGRGHKVGNDEGTLIHSDGNGTYLHALVTLEGPTTLVFPNKPELGGQRLTHVDDATGLATIQNMKGREFDGDPYVVSGVGRALPGETLLFGGWDYKKAKPGREAVQHASPVDSDLNRLTLFISIRPRRN